MNGIKVFGLDEHLGGRDWIYQAWQIKWHTAEEFSWCIPQENTSDISSLEVNGHIRSAIPDQASRYHNWCSHIQYYGKNHDYK